ncbi:MAG: ADP-ribosylglycohydrolase family protein [Planctomycetota bacterium]
MLPTLEQLHGLVHDAVGRLEAAGRDTAGVEDRLAGLPASYDALLGFAESLADLPMRAGWPYAEPLAWADVAASLPPPPETSDGWPRPVDPQHAADRIRQGWLASVCGCQLGKPLEVQATSAELREAFGRVGQWPIDDYVTPEALRALGREHPTGPRRGDVGPAHADDDLNYTVLGMLVLEQHGPGFTQADLRALWENHLPIRMTWGPERRGLAAWAVAANVVPRGETHPLHDLLVMGDTWCGAQIRADAYGYACPGDPLRAAELAYRDATLNHRGTGAFAAAWTAAAIAAAFAVDEPLDTFRVANRFVPPRSRFAEAMAEGLRIVERAADWDAGIVALHNAFRGYDHCRVLQESATLMLTARFAESVGHGLCLQVMAGHDTDSYAATAGALLGVLHDPAGPARLEARWLAPFCGKIDVALAQFHEARLDAIADRLAALPGRVRTSRG